MEHIMQNNIPPGYKVLAGSERTPFAQASYVGPVDPNERIEVSVYLRAPSTSNLAAIIEQVQRQGKPLSRAEYAASQSATSEDLAQVEEFAHTHHLAIVQTD